jgi:hypothetical protein
MLTAGRKSELQKWTGKPEVDKKRSFNFNASKKWKVQAELANVLSTSANCDKSEQYHIYGERASRYQLQEFVDVSPGETGIFADLRIAIIQTIVVHERLYFQLKESDGLAQRHSRGRTEVLGF